MKSASNSTNSEVGKIEENSNVEFPGESMEQLVGSVLTLENFEWTEDELIVVEVATPNFQYKYTIKSPAFIGKCEWC